MASSNTENRRSVVKTPVEVDQYDNGAKRC